MRDRLAEALSCTRISRAQRRGASESLPLEKPSRALEITGWARVGAPPPGPAAADSALLPRAPGALPAREPCPTLCCRCPQSRTRVPRRSAKLQRGWCCCALSAPRRRLPRPPRCKEALTGSVRDSAGSGTGAAVPHGAWRPRLRRGAHSPSLRHSATSTMASTTTTLAFMAPARGGRTQAGR